MIFPFAAERTAKGNFLVPLNAGRLTLFIMDERKRPIPTVLSSIAKKGLIVFAFRRLSGKQKIQNLCDLSGSAVNDNHQNGSQHAS